MIIFTKATFGACWAQDAQALERSIKATLKGRGGSNGVTVRYEPCVDSKGNAQDFGDLVVEGTEAHAKAYRQAMAEAKAKAEAWYE